MTDMGQNDRRELADLSRNRSVERPESEPDYGEEAAEVAADPHARCRRIFSPNPCPECERRGLSSSGDSTS
jgi:hypothetical protein